MPKATHVTKPAWGRAYTFFLIFFFKTYFAIGCQLLQLYFNPLAGKLELTPLPKGAAATTNSQLEGAGIHMISIFRDHSGPAVEHPDSRS